MDLNNLDSIPFSRSGYERLKDEIRRLRAEEDQHREIMILKSVRGFMNYYFKLLPKSRTKQEAFNQINDRYFELTGEFRYSDYNSFRQALRRYLSHD